MSEPAGGTAQAVERLVVHLGAALQQRAVYPPGHPQLVKAIDSAAAAHGALLAATGARETAIMVVEERLLVDRRPVPEEATWAQALLGWLTRLGISGLTLSAGLDRAELSAFLDGAQRPEGPSSSPHLFIGRVGYADAPAGETPVPAERPLLGDELLGRSQAALVALASGAAGDLDPLREVVAALGRAAGPVAPPRLPVSTPDERAFLHGLTTAAGALRLARAIGVGAERAGEIGLAGLLHDLGRIGGRGKWGLELHPVAGAARIAAVPGASDVAVAVAYEHHLRVDGVPSYPRLAAPRPPGAAARIVAVADTWDVLRTRGAAGPAEALTVLRERAGTWLDPDLVEVWAGLIVAGGT